MIIILGNEKDEHAKHVLNTLKELKKDCILLNTKKYPTTLQMNWNADENNVGYFNLDGYKINFKDIESIYWRNFTDIKHEIFEDGTNTEFLSLMIERERRSALHSLFYSLDLNWVNSMTAFDLHKKKAYLTHLFKQNGIRVPKTLITNDKEGLIKFYEENNKKIIYKPVLGGAFTQKLNDENLNEENLKTLVTTPVQFQEFVDGVDIRAYAFKDKIYACTIESTTLDFREDLHSKYTQIELPENVKQDCFKMMKIANLKYSGIDIRLNKEGEYVFIEANPAPMFIGAEKITKFPLTKELINLLTNN